MSAMAQQAHPIDDRAQFLRNPDGRPELLRVPWQRLLRGAPFPLLPYLLPSQQPHTPREEPGPIPAVAIPRDTPPSSISPTSPATSGIDVQSMTSSEESRNPLGWHYEDWKDTQWVVINAEQGPWCGFGAPSLWWVLRATHGEEQGVEASVQVQFLNFRELKQYRDLQG